jgi:hypothetical protein
MMPEGAEASEVRPADRKTLKDTAERKRKQRAGEKKREAYEKQLGQIPDYPQEPRDRNLGPTREAEIAAGAEPEYWEKLQLPGVLVPLPDGSWGVDGRLLKERAKAGGRGSGEVRRARRDDAKKLYLEALERGGSEEDARAALERAGEGRSLRTLRGWRKSTSKKT